jgi:hypothetical protein
LPYVEVAHLPSSSSYFAEILQPLGIAYIGASDLPHSTHQSVIFGALGHPVLEIRQVLLPKDLHRLTSLVFIAPTRAAVAIFRQRGIQANPSQSLELQESPDENNLTVAGGTRATIIDMDGNRIEAIYPGSLSLGETEKSSADAARRQPRTEEVGRILRWDQSAGTPSASTSQSSLCGLTRHQSSFGWSGESFHQPAEVWSRQVLGDTQSTTPASATNKQAVDLKESSSAIGTSTVVGTLLGLVTGAFLTYGMLSREKDTTSNAGHDHPFVSPPDFRSRQKFPSRDIKEHGEFGSFFDKNRLQGASSLHDDLGRTGSSYRPTKGSEFQQPSRESVPSQSANLAAGRAGLQAPDGATPADFATAPQGRYVEHPYIGTSKLGRATDDVRTGDATSAKTGHDSLAPGCPASSAQRRADSVTIHQTTPWPSSRAQSRVPTHVPTAILDIERETYVSARSRRSSLPFNEIQRSRVRAIESHADAQLMPASSHRSGRPVNVAQSGTSARNVRPPESNVSSYVSARDVPLPASGIGSSRAGWGDGDDDSIAPSDSISCVGDRRRDYGGDVSG